MDEGNPLNFQCPICEYSSDILRDKYTDFAYCPQCQFPVRSDSAIPLDDANIHKYINLCNKRMIILFWAPWDDASREAIAYLDMASHYEHDAVLVSVDTTRNPDAKRTFGVTLLPTIVVFTDRRETNRIAGSVSRFDLDRLISDGYV